MRLSSQLITCHPAGTILRYRVIDSLTVTGIVPTGFRSKAVSALLCAPRAGFRCIWFYSFIAARVVLGCCRRHFGGGSNALLCAKRRVSLNKVFLLVGSASRLGSLAPQCIRLRRLRAAIAPARKD